MWLVTCVEPAVRRREDQAHSDSHHRRAVALPRAACTTTPRVRAGALWCPRQVAYGPAGGSEWASRRAGQTLPSGDPAQLDELDVEGILAFAERVLPRAADLWVQASLEQRQRFQQLFFPEGIAFDGKGFVGTRVTAPAFSCLRTFEDGNERLVDQTGIEPVTS